MKQTMLYTAQTSIKNSEVQPNQMRELTLVKIIMIFALTFTAFR